MSSSDRYTQAGVNIDAGDRAKTQIASLVRQTFTPNVLHRDGAFGGLFSLGNLTYKNPVLVSSVDGVGTKVKVASSCGKHRGIGIDLVNHCIDDLLACGARPLFFLDYFACHTLDESILLSLVEGMSEACREAGTSLIGGETAQMSDVYAQGEYDLAGTIVGAVDEAAIIDGSKISPGDKLLGLPSTGLHTNGYTLARTVLLQEAALELDSIPEPLSIPLGDALLAPHRSYLPEVDRIQNVMPIHGIAHITGGGFEGNIERILPEGCAAVVDSSTWETPALFRLIQTHGSVSPEEMHRVFNMGIGMILILPREHIEEACSICDDAVVVGEITSGSGVEVK